MDTVVTGNTIAEYNIDFLGLANFVSTLSLGNFSASRSVIVFTDELSGLAYFVCGRHLDKCYRVLVKG